MYAHVCANTHACLLDSLFSFAWCIRFKLFACAFKALKYSDSDFISVINVRCHFSLLLSNSVLILPHLLSQLPVFY